MPEEVKPGRFYAALRGATTSKASTGSPQIVLDVGVTHRWDGTAWQPFQSPIERRVYLNLSGAAWPYTEEKLRKVGFMGNFDTPEFTENVVYLICEHDTYGGRIREKWEIDGFAGGEVEKADNKTIRDLNQRWKVGNAKKPTGQPSTPEPPESDKLLNEEPTPF